MATERFKYDVYAIGDSGLSRLLASFYSYEAAHYEAYGVWCQTGNATFVDRGDVRIWDSRNGFHEGA